MTSSDRTTPKPTFNAGIIVIGALLLGSVDALFAILFWAPHGVSAMRIFQSIAAGALGKASYAGGAETAWLGAGFHYFIALLMVSAYVLLSRQWAALVSKPWLCGAAYGVFLYLFMNFIVLPLSAVGLPKFDNPWWVGSSVLVHAGLGLICAFTARRTLRT